MRVSTRSEGSAGCLLTATERKVSQTDAPSLSETEQDYDGQQNGVGNNAIPLPPRDRSRSLLHVGKPRHERKHPLIIPTHAVAQALAAATAGMNHTAVGQEPTYLGLEDEPSSEGCEEVVGRSSPLSHHQGAAPTVNTDTHLPASSAQRYPEESFEDRIANDFDLLDRMAEEEEDLVDGSGGGSGSTGNRESTGLDDTSESDDIETESQRHLIAIINNVLGYKETCGEKPVITGTPKVCTLEGNDGELLEVHLEPGHRLFDTHVEYALLHLRKPLHHFTSSTLEKCLLTREFFQFGGEVSDTECIQSLGTCRGDVHRAIKLIRLRRLLATSAHDSEVQRCDSVSDLCALELNDWNVARAAKHRINEMSPQRQQ
ncbi:hypothetical protein AAG570_004951 [Ranatra chinensis]|uniref:Uncharacterized protein n=1 Tax=Ranatra chinensis TaxID=642074 RepID=A0ABD0YHD2_9HEMI